MSIIQAVMMVTEKLTDRELAALSMVAQTRADPHNRIFDYEVVESLFTIDGVIMEQATLDALATIAIERLSPCLQETN